MPLMTINTENQRARHNNDLNDFPSYINVHACTKASKTFNKHMMFRRKWNKFVQIANILRVRADEILNFNMDGWMVFLEGKPLTRDFEGLLTVRMGL